MESLGFVLTVTIDELLSFTVGAVGWGTPDTSDLGFSSWASQIPQGNLGHIPAFEGLGCIYWFKI